MDDKAKKKWLQDIKSVLATPQGRRVYWGIMAKCGAFEEKFIESTNLSFFRKGQRSIGINMLNDLLEADQNKYLQMVQENDAKQTRDEIKTSHDINDRVKNPTKIRSSSLPNTELVSNTGGKK